MKNKIGISIDKLSKIINVHKKTLTSWLCHYSLSPFVYNDIDKNNKTTMMFNLNKRSLGYLKSYLKKKNKKYLQYLQTLIKD